MTNLKATNSHDNCKQFKNEQPIELKKEAAKSLL